jgi:L-rhamnonate dehydratase
MKIKDVCAFAIPQMTAGGGYSAGAPGSVEPRRPPWTRDAEVANAMSRYSRALRSARAV